MNVHMAISKYAKFRRIPIYIMEKLHVQTYLTDGQDDNNMSP